MILGRSRVSIFRPARRVIARAASGTMKTEASDKRDEVRQLRGCINDLVSVLALPAICNGSEPIEIVTRLLDTVLGGLSEVIWIAALNPEWVVYVSSSFERVWGLPVKDLYRNPRLWRS